MVQVGTAGHKNLDAHRALKACHAATHMCEKAACQRPLKPNQVLETFFKPRAPLNPPRVSALAPLHAAEASKQLICQRGLHLFQDLEASINQIPIDVPNATPEDCLSVFAADPYACVAESEEEDWPILNAMLKSSFGWGETEMATVIPKMLKRGEYGLDRFVRFMRFYVVERSLQGVLFEMKIEALLRELESQ